MTQTETGMNQEIERLTKSLGLLREEHSLVPKAKCVGAVKKGDYLLYKATEYHDKKFVVVDRCRRVLATHSIPGSGIIPDKYYLLVEGDEPTIGGAFKDVKEFGEHQHVFVLERVKG